MAYDLVLLGVVVAFCFGTSDFISKGLTGQVGYYRTSVYAMALSGLLLVVPSLLFESSRPISLYSAGLLALLGVITYLAFVLLYRSYQKGTLSVVSPTANSFPVFSVLFALVILKVAISSEELAALAGVVVGVFLVSTDLSALRRSKKASVTPGVPEALLAAVCFAAAFTLIGYSDSTIGYLVPIIAGRLGAATVGFLAGIPLKQDLRPFRGAPLRRLTAISVLEATGLIAFNLALVSSSALGGLPVASTLASMGVVFTVGFAKVFLKEHVGPTYAAGIVILIASVAALLYFTA